MITKRSKMNILAIGPHPDDIEIGCGATLAKSVERGHDVYLFVATEGAAGGEEKVRRKEQEDSAKILGAKQLFWGAMDDTKIEANKESIMQLEKIIEIIQPDLIFVNYVNDTHQDHRNMAAIVTSATRYVRNVLYYETPTTLEFHPNIYVELNTELIETKEQMLLAHASQIDRTNIKNLSIIEVSRSSAHFRGVQARVAYAEAFQSVRLFLNL